MPRFQQFSLSGFGLVQMGYGKVHSEDAAHGRDSEAWSLILISKSGHMSCHMKYNQPEGLVSFHKHIFPGTPPHLVGKWLSSRVWGNACDSVVSQATKGILQNSDPLISEEECMGRRKQAAFLLLWWVRLYFVVYGQFMKMDSVILELCLKDFYFYSFGVLLFSLSFSSFSYICMQ